MGATGPTEPSGSPSRITWSDATVAAAVFTLNISTALLASTRPFEPSLDAVAVTLLLAQSFALLPRRAHPVVAIAVVGVFAAAYGMADWPDPLAPFGPFVALATVVERCRRRTALAVTVISAFAVVAATAAPGDSDALDWGVALLSMVLAVVVGEVLRGRQTALAELEQRNQRAQAEQRRAVEAARLAERQQVARELHDVVTHHVTMLVVRAEAAASDLERRGDGERAATFDELAASGRNALAELRQLLGVLRSPDDSTPSMPTPGICRVDDLIERARATGLEIDYRSPSPIPDLPTAVDLAGYRVVQEGLTNVIKHAGAHHALVSITVDDAGLDVEVSDDGVGGIAPDGIGLTGLRERISLLGGSLEAGPRHDKGYRVHARIPAGTRP